MIRGLLEGRLPGYEPADSDRERWVRQVLLGAGLPEPVPQYQTVVGGRVFVVDLAYPDQRIAIEYARWRPPSPPPTDLAAPTPPLARPGAARSPGECRVTVVYTDGACVGNPGPGGWAWAVPNGASASGADALTTNQRMEIKAALEAVRAIDGLLEVRSDSTYVVNCFRQRWWEGWLQRGWLNKARKPVANRDLWEPLVDLVVERGDVTFSWVKGHSGDAMNDLVDRMAVEAARAQRGGGGPAGHRLVVVGHRPPALGGYGPNPTADAVRRKLREILGAKRELHGDLVVLTGLGLGAEQLGAEAAAECGIPYVAVLPFPDQDSVWPETSKRRYRELLDGAQSQVVLQARAPATKQAAGQALARRDAWLAEHADEAVAVWDGDDAALGRTVRAFEQRLGDDVWTVETGP